MNADLSRFVWAHEKNFDVAFSEIRNGQKQSHWIWYIFPQLKGLGRSEPSEYYGIKDLEEARAFLRDGYLGQHLLAISSQLLRTESSDARAVMGGGTDAKKLWSSMTLFHLADPGEPVFADVLEKFFGGRLDRRTVEMLGSDDTGSGQF